MHKIGDDTSTVTPDGEFTEGDPVAGQLATDLKAPWLNTIQRELLAVLAAAAINPAGDDDDQVLEALQILFAARAHNHDTVYSKLDHLHDTLYAASLLVQSGQLLLKARSGGTLSTVDLSPLPPGTVICHAATSAPAGFLECNGLAVSRSTYAALFAVIGTTHGGGDGSTTFNLPDLRGEFVRGWDHGRGVDSGRSFASAQADELESHRHESIRYSDGQSAVLSPGDGATQHGPTPQMGENDYPILHTSSTGGAETRPRNVALLYVIKF